MRTNLSSQISLNRVSPKYYKPENAVERSVLTRCEKVPTDIYETMEEGVQHIANEITAKIQERQREGKFCVIGAGTGASLRPLYAELVRKHKDEGLSFRNVVIFNLYEYYPLASEGAGSSFSQLNDLFLSQIDIDKQNVFTIDGTIPQEAVIEYCRLYEQRIQTFGGIDIVLMGIGREGNIAMNEPGSSLSSPTRLILIDSTSRAEAAHNLGVDNLPPCSITMGVATIMAARKIYLLAWGDDKADIIKKAVEDKVSDTLPASYLQMHNNANVCIDLAAASHLTRIQRPWLVTNCEWNDKLIRSAIVWLCMRVKKPILKLTNKDYNENGLSELLALYGSAYNVNIKIFNDLQHTNYRQHRRVSFYANALSLTPRHLTTVIRQASGRSASQWIEEYTVLEAQILLRNSPMSIKEIAYELGFNDQSLFSKYFSRVTGISPERYRKISMSNT